MSNVFSFLIATDCHLGYEEADRLIGDDSFITFEEILIKAVEQDVDLILLGGDLFHHNNPSQKCMHRCMELLRRYTLGDRPVYFELLSNAAEVFQSSLSRTTNYLDDNINVSIPVFSIHGNHDDPSGLGQACALDTLSSAGLINYFGKWTDLEDVEIKPVLLRKGKTRIAVYGLSHIKDDRLCRLFIDNKVKFIRPENEPNKWFNIFVLHQNRVDRGPKRFISESYIPDFMDLVIWGHEHDCEIEPVQNLEKGFYVIQPGSSVPTSLCEGESLEKHVAVLKVFEKKMKIKPLKLNTTRPFVWRSVNLWDVDVTASDNEREKKSEEIKAHCQTIVEEMIADARKLITGHTKQPKLPLVRLRCFYNDETQMFNIVKFGQMFAGRVASPYGEIVRMVKKSTPKEATKKPTSEDLIRLSELYKQDMEDAGNFTACVNHIVRDYFTNHEEAKMLILRVREMGTAVEKFVEKDDSYAIEELIDKRFARTLKELIEQKVNADETNLKELWEQQREEYEKMDLKEESDLEKKLNSVAGRQKREDVPAGGRNSPSSEIGDPETDDFSEPDVFGNEAGGKNVISDSGTDEYDVENDFDMSSKSPSISKIDDMFGSRRGKANAKEESKAQGRGRRGRGAGGGRGRGSRGGGEGGRGRGSRGDEAGKRKTNAESSRKSPKATHSTARGTTRQPLKFQDTFAFESDSD